MNFVEELHKKFPNYDFTVEIRYVPNVDEWLIQVRMRAEDAFPCFGGGNTLQAAIDAVSEDIAISWIGG